MKKQDGNMQGRTFHLSCEAEAKKRPKKAFLASTMFLKQRTPGFIQTSLLERLRLLNCVLQPHNSTWKHPMGGQA